MPRSIAYSLSSPWRKMPSAMPLYTIGALAYLGIAVAIRLAFPTPAPLPAAPAPPTLLRSPASESPRGNAGSALISSHIPSLPSSHMLGVWLLSWDALIASSDPKRSAFGDAMRDASAWKARADAFAPIPPSADLGSLEGTDRPSAFVGASIAGPGAISGMADGFLRVIAGASLVNMTGKTSSQWSRRSPPTRALESIEFSKSRE